jgi:ubiquinol-cytochrome c reductase cytochrome c1 subunit
MPFVLADLQGTQEAVTQEGHVVKVLLKEAGSMSAVEYDHTIADLVNYMVFMSEPAILVRHQIGWIVLIFLSILLVLMYALKKEIWKDIH